MRKSGRLAAVEVLTAAEAKSKLYAVLDSVATSGRHYLLTRRGIPVARITPASVATKNGKSAFGCMRGMMTLGDVLSPLGEDEWTVPESALGKRKKARSHRR